MVRTKNLAKKGATAANQPHGDVVKKEVVPSVSEGSVPAKRKKAKFTAAEVRKRERKAKRRRIRVLKDIKRCQSAPGLLTSRAAMARAIRSIAAEHDATLRFQPDAIDALMVGAEDAITEALARSNECAVQVAERQGPLLRDFQFVVSKMPHFAPGGVCG